jgi:hypothetical protein
MAKGNRTAVHVELVWIRANGKRNAEVFRVVK